MVHAHNVEVAVKHAQIIPVVLHVVKIMFHRTVHVSHVPKIANQAIVLYIMKQPFVHNVRISIQEPIILLVNHAK